MRSIKRNKKPFYYSTLKKKKEVVDENGFYTGEYELEYSEPLLEYGVISENQGNVKNEMFGNYRDYDKVITIDNLKCTIDENSEIWEGNYFPGLQVGVNFILGCQDAILKENKRLPNAIVTRVSKTKNVITVAIKDMDGLDEN